MKNRIIFIILLSALSIYFEKHLRETINTISDMIFYKDKDSSHFEVKERLFSADELLRYNGEPDSEGLYLAIIGQVFDVSKGLKHYGPGGSYHVFAGRDASKAFITGEFESTTDIDDVLSLNDRELLSLKTWADFYKKEYKYVGKMIGKFYDALGQETDYMKGFRNRIEAYEQKKLEDEKIDRLYPACNAEWNEGLGTKLWCTNKSGGIDRDWIGVPRKMFIPADKSHRCVCVQDPSASSARFEEYENCEETSHTCVIRAT